MATFFLKTNAFKRVRNSKSIQQPKQRDNDHNHVDDGFYFAIHRDKTIDKPKQNADNDEGDDDTDNRHIFFV